MSKRNKKCCGILIKCGKRYLVVHDSGTFAPTLTDGKWNIPKGRQDENDGDELGTAIRETFEETGIDLKTKRDQIKQLTEYTVSTGKAYVVFSYEDKNTELMNHKFYCKSEKIHHGILMPEVDSYHWVTKKEFKQYVPSEHTKNIFKNKS